MTKPVRFVVERHYAMSADQHFAEIVKFDELAEAMVGQVRYVGLPAGEAETGQSIDLRLYLWGWLPIGAWHISVCERDDQQRILRSSESGGVVKSMTHMLSVSPDGHGGCVHVDAIEVDAGLFTPWFARVARSMYEKRHDVRARLRGQTV